MVDITTEEVKKPKAPKQGTEEDHRADRDEVLSYAPEGMTQTDLDMGQFYKVNGEWWMPPVTDIDPITDYTKYCFACKTQLSNIEREPCAGVNKL